MSVSPYGQSPDLIATVTHNGTSFEASIQVVCGDQEVFLKGFDIAPRRGRRGTDALLTLYVELQTPPEPLRGLWYHLTHRASGKKRDTT